QVHVVGRHDVAAGDDERVVLGQAVGVAVHGLHVHAVRFHHHGVAAGEGRLDVHVLDVVHDVARGVEDGGQVRGRDDVGVGGGEHNRFGEIAAGGEIISHPDQRSAVGQAGVGGDEHGVGPVAE